jgi:ketosteroid isomerase-like protein
MSQETVEVVRRVYAATPGLRDSDPAADREFLDRMFGDFFDADLTWHLPPEYPEGAQLARGRDGLRAFIAMLREAWSEWRFVPERFFDAGDRVLVFVHVVAVGRESGVPIGPGDGASLDDSRRAGQVRADLPGSFGGPRGRGAAGVAMSQENARPAGCWLA